MEQQGRRAIGRVCPRGAESYTWQEGDTAERIARTYATTVQALQVINPGVDFATLTAGEEICLPNFIYTCISGQPYVVEDGDTFASIAARLDITENSARVIEHRTRARLRADLTKEGYE